METMITDTSARRNIAANLSRILKGREISQTQLAAMTGDPITTISRVYRGLNVPGAGVLARIAEALDVSVDRLMATPPEKILEKSALALDGLLPNMVDSRSPA